MRMTPALIAGEAICACAVRAGPADAAEIKVLASNAMKTALEELAPQFEKATEHKLKYHLQCGCRAEGRDRKGRGVRCRDPQHAHHRRPDQAGQARWQRPAPTSRARTRALRSKRARRSPTSARPSVQARAARCEIDLLCRAGRDGHLSQGTVRAPRHRRAVKAQDQAAAAVQPGRARGGERRGRDRHDPDQRNPALCRRRAGRSACRRRSSSPRCSRPRSAPAPRSRKPPRRFIKFLTAPAALPVLKAKGLEPG